MQNVNVGDAVVWQSRVGPVAAEFRGRFRGDDGRAMACVIVRPPGEPPYQTGVPVDELRPATA